MCNYVNCEYKKRVDNLKRSKNSIVHILNKYEIKLHDQRGKKYEPNYFVQAHTEIRLLYFSLEH